MLSLRIISFIGRFLPAFFLSLTLLGLSMSGHARPRPSYAVAGNEKPVALLHVGKATYLVTQHSVFRLEGQQFVRHYQGEAPVQCAAVADTVLWLGTRQGLVRLNYQGFRPHKQPLPGVEPFPSITALFRDARGTMWVGAYGQGVFHEKKGAFTQELNTPAINGGAATADSSVWIATNIGLSRKQHQDWTRYNEEGVANQEIPDNIVEKLLPDNVGNLWVIMSDAICVFEGQAQRSAAEAELPTVKFLGRPGNEVHSVAYLKGEGRLFATAMGLLLLPQEPANHLPSFTPSTDKIEQKQLLVPLPAPAGAGNPFLLEVDKQQRLWLVSEGKVTVLTAKEFHQLVHSRNGAQGVAGRY
ncbi:hypothetical protein IC235_15230 [Hymenobacter sp. BT664]|uniref:Histidine kinase n=1 Tax=Hymenobacter montanus TaxID=2771359 RepID=A0A927BG28_9BACT|nr:two-component regulator propeller domain-containing protein [Hymenobacter montanus]MBD2769243.1 hypothetical protein [Hymenobacter montanus]